MSSIFSEIDIPFVVCVIYWSLPTSGSPQEIAWNGPKLVYDCVVWAAAVVPLILYPPHLGICFKLICIVFRGVAAGVLIMPALQAGDAALTPPPHPGSLRTTESEQRNCWWWGQEPADCRLLGSWNSAHGWTLWWACAWKGYWQTANEAIISSGSLLCSRAVRGCTSTQLNFIPQGLFTINMFASIHPGRSSEHTAGLI